MIKNSKKLRLKDFASKSQLDEYLRCTVKFNDGDIIDKTNRDFYLFKDIAKSYSEDSKELFKDGCKGILINICSYDKKSIQISIIKDNDTTSFATIINFIF